MKNWHLAFGCTVRFGILESTYRSAKMYPGDERVFVSYTTTLSTDTMDAFFSNSSLAVKGENAATALRKNLGANASRCKQAMQRVNVSEEEFFVLLALSFWNTEIPSGDERLSMMAAANRTVIMQELHEFYAVNGLTEYAARIGELFCLLVDNERVASLITEDMELLRLIDANAQQGII